MNMKISQLLPCVFLLCLAFEAASIRVRSEDTTAKLVSLHTPSVGPNTPPPWPSQFQVQQIIHIPELGAVQEGGLYYDFAWNRIREDQNTVKGAVPGYNKSISEWFIGDDWYFVDWVASTCQHANFGIGPVKPNWFQVNATTMDPVFLYDRFSDTYQKMNWLRSDYFGVFEYYVRANDTLPFRLRMPGATSLAGMTLMVDLVDWFPLVNLTKFELPKFCNSTVHDTASFASFALSRTGSAALGTPGRSKGHLEESRWKY